MTTILDLPCDVLCHVFGFVKGEQQLSVVCRTWYRTLRTQVLPRCVAVTPSELANKLPEVFPTIEEVAIVGSAPAIDLSKLSRVKAVKFVDTDCAQVLAHSLTAIDVSGTYSLTDAHVIDACRVCTHLEKLSYARCRNTGAGALRAALSHPRLKVLDVTQDFMDCDEASLLPQGICPAVEILSVARSIFGIPSLWLNRCQNLTALDAAHTVWSTDDPPLNLPRLRHIDLTGTTSFKMDHLFSSELIDFRFGEVTKYFTADFMACLLTKCPNLRLLDLRQTTVYIRHSTAIPAQLVVVTTPNLEKWTKKLLNDVCVLDARPERRHVETLPGWYPRPLDECAYLLPGGRSPFDELRIVSASKENIQKAMARKWT